MRRTVCWRGQRLVCPGGWAFVALLVLGVPGAALAGAPRAVASSRAAGGSRDARDEARFEPIRPGLFPWLGAGRALSSLAPGQPMGLRADASEDAEEPDDSDLMPDLVPLVDPSEDAGDQADAMSIPALDLTGDDAESTKASETPDEAANATSQDAAKEEALAPPVRGEEKPIVKQWWFWAAIGAAVLAGGGAVAAASGPEVVPPSGSLGTMDRR